MKTRWALLGVVVSCIVCRSAQETRLSTSLSPSFNLQFNAVPGFLYDVEASTNLSSWELLTTIRAQAAIERLADSNSITIGQRFFRVADLSPYIVVEGLVDTIDSGYVLVSSSLDASTTYTDPSGHYVLRTSTPATPSHLPFTLHFSNVGYRPLSVIVTNPTLPR